MGSREFGAKPRFDVSVNLGRPASVFQAELNAIYFERSLNRKLLILGWSSTQPYWPKDPMKSA